MLVVSLQARPDGEKAAVLCTVHCCLLAAEENETGPRLGQGESMFINYNVCVCVLCRHAYPCTCILCVGHFLCVCACTCVCVCMFVCVCLCVCMCVCVFTCSYIRTCMVERRKKSMQADSGYFDDVSETFRHVSKHSRDAQKPDNEMQ